MTYIMVDVEADGPIPGDYSMVCFGAIVVEPSLDRTFYGRLKPISEKWIPEALQVSGFSRDETLAFDEPSVVMQQFTEWVAEVGGSGLDTKPKSTAEPNSVRCKDSAVHAPFHDSLGVAASKLCPCVPHPLECLCNLFPLSLCFLIQQPPHRVRAWD